VSRSLATHEPPAEPDHRHGRVRPPVLAGFFNQSGFLSKRGILISTNCVTRETNWDRCHAERPICIRLFFATQRPVNATNFSWRHIILVIATVRPPLSPVQVSPNGEARLTMFRRTGHVAGTRRTTTAALAASGEGPHRLSQ